MGRRPITTFTLAHERAEQLKTIAAANYLSVTGLIARFINAEIRKGTIPDEIPGYRIKRIGQHVEIGIDRATLMATVDQANYIAKTLDQIANDPNSSAFSSLRSNRTFYTHYGSDYFEVASGDFVLIRRRGRGLVIEVNMHRKGRIAAQRSLGPDVAHDLVRLIRAAAKKSTRR